MPIDLKNEIKVEIRRDKIFQQEYVIANNMFPQLTSYSL